MNLRRITASKVKKVLIVNSDPEILNILEVNMKHANLEVLTARNGREALGKVNTDNPDIILIDNSLPDIEGVELCQKLRTECTHHIPMILIGAKTQKKDRNSKVINGADSYVYKPFDPKEVVNLVLAYLIQKERVENLNPLTGLPDQTQISNEITRLIAQKKTFAAVYIAMDDLKAFNKVYGYDQGDRTIRLLADIVSEAVRLFGNPDDLVGHLGGDKFVVISTPWKSRPVCRRIIADFNRRVRALYTDEHLQRGYITYESPSGEESQGPIMSLRVAVVTNQVMAKPDVFFGDAVHPIGGHIVGHTSHTRIYLRRASRGPIRIARLVSSPYLPEGEEILKVTENGIEDVSEDEKSSRSRGR